MVSAKKYPRGFKRFRLLLRKWRGLWRCNAYWLEVTAVDKFDELDGEDGQFFNTAAEVTYSGSYKLCEVTVDHATLKKHDKLEEVACHEMAHLVLAPTDRYVGHLIEQLPESSRDLANRTWKDIKESTTTQLTQVGMSLDDRSR